MKTQLRVVLLIAITASFIAFLDGTVVGIALPAIRHDLGGGLAIQQWINDAYLISVGALILVAGTLSDNFGRVRILRIGLYGFLLTSLMCAASPSGLVLIIGRAAQGVAGALLVPSSLALIIDYFQGKAQARAIGQWTAWTGIAFIIGPLIGGALVQYVSWRFVFGINVIPIVMALILLRTLRDSRELHQRQPLDIPGLLLAALGLGAIVFGLIELGTVPPSMRPILFATTSFGLILVAGFVVRERITSHPMLPLTIFRHRNFSVGNAATLLIYAGLSLQSFLLVIFLQQVSHYSAIAAGLVSLPVTLAMFFLSARFGGLAGRFGPRFFMSVGPVLAGVGDLWLTQVSVPTIYMTQLLPPIMLFALGLSMTVSPLTAAILGSISSNEAGIGSAVNNAVARIAGLLSVGVIGLLIGDTVSLSGFHVGMLTCASLLVAGGVVSFAGIRNVTLPADSRRETQASSEAP